MMKTFDLGIHTPYRNAPLLFPPNKALTVLSLFDGISCGQLALKQLNVPIQQYFASEIEPDAIRVTQHHFPHTIQLGDVTQIQGKNLPQIDLLIGGSPCQGFSVAGKQLNFEDPRSKLFFEFVRLLEECKPTYFLLENVCLQKVHRDTISHYCGIHPLKINSNLFSAQHRNRYYWTTIPKIQIPHKEDPHKIQDILQNIPVNQRNIVNPKQLHTLKKKKNYISYDINGLGNNSLSHRIYFLKSKYGTIIKGEHKKILLPCGTVAQLTVIELERLQTLPDNYTQISEGFPTDNKRRDMLGNCWTVEVIKHLFKNMFQKGH